MLGNCTKRLDYRSLKYLSILHYQYVKHAIAKDCIEEHAMVTSKVCLQRNLINRSLSKYNTNSGFTGIDAPYEAPKNPDLTIDTSIVSTEQAVEMITSKLAELVSVFLLFHESF